MTVNMGPGWSFLPLFGKPLLIVVGYNTSYSPHCLTRDLAPSFAISKLNASGVAYTLAAKNYFEFDIRVEGGVDVPSMTYHGGGHLGVGGDLGEMGNVYSSPGDPLFYLHVSCNTILLPFSYRIALILTREYSTRTWIDSGIHGRNNVRITFPWYHRIGD